MRRIEAITFDLDGTLLDGRGVQRAMVQTCDEIASWLPGLEAGDLKRRNDEAWAEYWPEVEAMWPRMDVSGDRVSAEIWRRTLAACGFEDEALAQRVAEVFVRHQVANLALFEDVLPVLTALKQRYPLALITNGPSDHQRRALRTVGIEAEFEAILVSGEVGAQKPDLRIFQLAAESLGHEPAKLLHVGDNAVADVVGARDAGFAAAWLDREGVFTAREGHEAELKICSLQELPPLLAAAARN